LYVTATDGRLAVDVDGDEQWSGDFQAMSGLERLEPGYYGDLQRYPLPRCAARSTGRSEVPVAS
jgi:hypothetical protein